jgi:hypothetical protein
MAAINIEVMKKIFLCMTLVATGATGNAQIPVGFIIKEGVRKVIVAMDLKIQRLQTRTIWLQNAQKVIENTMSQLKLTGITTWVQRQKDLYQEYFDELWKIKGVVADFHRVSEITRQEAALVNQFHMGWDAVSQDKHFSPGELRYIESVYSGILSESLQNLDRLDLVIQPFTTRMSDGERLDMINRIANQMQKNYDDLEQFNSQTIGVSLLRSRDQNDLDEVKNLYGLP